MKKILVVLLILAVATGVFAQGNWSLTGQTDIGVRLNLDTGDDPLRPWQREAVTSSGRVEEGWNVINGQMGLVYSTGGLSVDLAFSTRANENYAGFTYYGENFSFRAATNLSKLFSQFAYTITNPGAWNEQVDASNAWDGLVDRLYGTYDVLNGLVNLHVAYKSAWNPDFWASDLTAAPVHNGTNHFYHYGWGYQVPTNDYASADPGFFGKSQTWTKTDGNNFFMTTVNLDNINFGVFVPDVFGDGNNGTDDDAITYTAAAGPNPASGGFVIERLMQTVFGLKFNMHPVEFATQVKLEDYGVYFGGKFFTGPITAGLSFSGLLNPGDQANRKFIKFGGDVEYNADLFGAGVAAAMERTSAVNDPLTEGSYGQVIRVQPRFFYNAIPSHLRIQLDAGFYFFSYNPANSTDKESDMTWAVQPALFWNFLGTGATDGIATGMMFRYRVASSGDNLFWGTDVGNSKALYFDVPWVGGNNLDAIFRWSF